MYPIIDMHCDTMICVVGADKGGLRQNDAQLDLNKLRAGGSMVQCFALYLAEYGSPDYHLCSDPDDPMDFFSKAADLFDREIGKNADMIAHVRSYDDILEAHGAGKLGALMSVEDSVFLEGDLARLDMAYERGVRLMSLTWNFENTLGFPNRPDGPSDQGLKPFGIEAVRRMNELGIIVDVAHLSDGGIYDVAKYSKKPFVASHSNARALCPVPRNLTDDMLRLIGDSGGVAGLNFCIEFLRFGEKGTAYIEDIARHARYMADRAGVEAVGFGSDMDGITNELEFVDASGMQLMAQGLEKYFTPREVELITHKNVLRLIKDCCK